MPIVYKIFSFFYLPFFNSVAKEKPFLGRKNICGAFPPYNPQVTTTIKVVIHS